jgi:hypothetical protein
MRSILLTVALLAATLTPAHADTFTFTSTDGTLDVTGAISGLPTFTEPANGGAVYENVPITNNGTPLLSDIAFFNPVLSSAAGLPPLDFTFYIGSDFYGYGGPQVYTGSPSDPVLMPGTYDLTGYVGTYAPGEFTASGGGTLTIAATPAVPEPSSLILLGSGVLSLAAVARRALRRATSPASIGGF